MKYASDNRIVRWFYWLTTGPYRIVFYAAAVLFFLVGIYLPVRDMYVAQRTVNILQEQNAIEDAYIDEVGKEVKTYLSQEGIEDTARRELNMVQPGERTITVEGLDEDGNPIVETDEGSADGAQQDGQDAAKGDASADANQGDDGAGADASADDDKEDSGMLKGEDAADKSKTGTKHDAKGASGGTPKTSAEVEEAQRAVVENSAWYWKLLDAVFFFNGTDGMALTSTGE